MRLIFVDDSIAYDGFTPASQPLGGAEKSLALLAPALAARGHSVEIYNRCQGLVSAHGATWLPFESERPTMADCVIALRKPELLDYVTQPRKSILWASGPIGELDEPGARSIIDAKRPHIVFAAAWQRNRWKNPNFHDTRVIAPGLGADFVANIAMAPADPPRAIATAHPLAGLDWLIKMWVAKIRPMVPNAELHVFSAILDRAQLGETVAPEFRPVADLMKTAREHGVVARWPLADPAMADEYRSARAFLHPGFPGETVGLHLIEAQAAGLPVVTRVTSPIAEERIADGQSGVIAKNNDGFAQATISLLTDRIHFNLVSSNASSIRRGRTWPVVAAEWEALFD
jgi:glycosyltransferase involved in cell wall biosynthesis